MTLLAMIESTIHQRRIAATELAGPPLFILGHWRTGTTHIHNLLSRDPQFAYLSNFVAFATNTCIVARPLLQRVIRSATPVTRPMDGMSLDFALPQEEEYGLANLSSLSYYNQYSFPQLSPEYARRHIFFEGVPPKEIEVWKRWYDFLLRKTTYVTGNRPLLLKNPPNTARLSHLLDLYPDAKIIYMYRDPYEVYVSTLRMREAVCNMMRFQDYDAAAMSEHILDTYPRLIHRFFDDLPRVRPGHLVAIDYQDLKLRPLATVERVYATLGLNGFAANREHFSRYLDSVSEFQPMKYRADDAQRRLVEDRWRDAHSLHERFARVAASNI
jgi:hypothetical protein